MERTPKITVNGLCTSIHAAIYEYMDRHHGQRPAQITMTAQVYAAILASTTVRYANGDIQCFGIPVVVDPRPGYHVHLAEPQITIYEPDDTPRLRRPDTKEEG